MSDTQVRMLIVAMLESLASLVLVFLFTYSIVSSLLKPPRRVLRGFIAFLVAWLAVGFALPFRSVRYYDTHRDEFYLILLIASLVASVAASKLAIATRGNLQPLVQTMDASFDLPTILAKIKSAFRPLECVVEAYDFEHRIRFRVFAKDDEPLLTMEDLPVKNMATPGTLNTVIREARSRIEKKGITLEPWQVG